MCIAAYLVGKLGYKPKEACELILKNRLEAFHFAESLNFSSALVKYYNDIKKCKR